MHVCSLTDDERGSKACDVVWLMTCFAWGLGGVVCCDSMVVSRYRYLGEWVGIGIGVVCCGSMLLVFRFPAVWYLCTSVGDIHPNL